MDILREGRGRVAALPDIHAPFVDVRAFKEALKVVRAYKPDLIVLLGDTLDCLALSGYSHPQDLALGDDWVAEVEKSAFVYRDIEKLRASLGADVVEFEGNHEERRGRAKNVPIQFQRALDINRVCPKIGAIRTGRHWKVRKYNRTEGIAHWGGLVFMHGFGHGSTAGEKDALRVRLELSLANLVYPKVVAVRGHQHAIVPLNGGGPLPVRCRMIDTGISWCSPGTLGPARCTWDHAVNDSEWGPGVFLGELDLEGRVVEAKIVRL